MNEIKYVLESTDTTAQGFALEIRLRVAYDLAGIYTGIKTVVLKPNSDGKTVFYVQDFINSYLAWQLPDFNEAFTTAVSQTVRFYIEFREISIANIGGSWTSDAGNVCRAIKGGIEKQVWSGNNYFDWQTTNKSFLTWQPAGRFIHYNQPQFLTVRHSTTSLKRKLTIKATDGTTYTNTINFPTATLIRMFHLNVSPAFLDLKGLASGKNVWWYEVSVLDAANADAELFGPYRLYIDYSPVYDEQWDFIYLNSLGGVDVARVRGDMEWAYEKEAAEGSGNVDTTGAGSTLKTAEMVSTRPVRRDVFKGDIGYCRTAEEQEAYMDLLMSDYIFIWKDSRYMQIHNINRSGRVRRRSDTKYSFPIEWMMPFVNSVFTPRRFALGL